MKRIVIPSSLLSSIQKVQNHTDGWPWYWSSYGEKCYAFCTCSAYPVNEGDLFPRPGTELTPHPENQDWLVGENGTLMIIDEVIAEIERQNGAIICEFIAKAHAVLLS